MRANPDRWEERDTRTSWIVNRGYTGHEHLDAFGVIDMNGRVYDPFTALFMSPDPYVQSPSDWLNYNRYSYCLNNPFKYTDPSGEIAFLLIPAVAFLINMGTAAAVGAAIAGAFSVATTIVNGSSWDASSFWKSVGNGAISGAITFGIGSAFGATGGAAASFANVNKGFLGISNAFLNEAGRAGAHALAQGAMTAADGGNFWAGAASGAFGSITGHTLDALHVDFVVNNPFGVVAFAAFSGGMGSVFAGGDFWEGAKSGAIVGACNQTMHYIQKPAADLAHALKSKINAVIKISQKVFISDKMEVTYETVVRDGGNTNVVLTYDAKSGNLESESDTNFGGIIKHSASVDGSSRSMSVGVTEIGSDSKGYYVKCEGKLLPTSKNSINVKMYSPNPPSSQSVQIFVKSAAAIISSYAAYSFVLAL